MKKILTGVLIVMAFTTNAQEINKKIEDPLKYKEIMLNLCSREALTNFDEFKASYVPNYENYQLDSLTIDKLKKLTKGSKVTIILGTWCGDSKFQVPHFLKVSDSLQWEEKDIKFIAVDGAKKAENGLIDKLKIERVPTFIFANKNGEEIGRITENPKETLEKDMLKIYSGIK